MFTIIMTLIGIAVFIVTLLFSGIKLAIKRLLMCTMTGFVIDIVFLVFVSGLIGLTH